MYVYTQPYHLCISAPTHTNSMEQHPHDLSYTTTHIYIYTITPALDINIQEKANNIEASVIPSLAQADAALYICSVCVSVYDLHK